eukprot:12014816-Heterocapsa_arctica.AAC.1
MVLDVMRFCDRLGLKVTYKHELDCIKELFDQALCSIFAEMRTQGVTITAFWKVYGAIAGLVTDAKL